ncbi:MAG: hypothetical protein ACR2FY_03430 [Pirellulaceae bacterium]
MDRKCWIVLTAVAGSLVAGLILLVVVWVGGFMARNLSYRPKVVPVATTPAEAPAKIDFFALVKRLDNVDFHCTGDGEKTPSKDPEVIFANRYLLSNHDGGFETWRINAVADWAESQGHWLGPWNEARTDWVFRKWNAVEDSLPDGMTTQIAVVIWDTHRYFQEQRHQAALDKPLGIEVRVVPKKGSFSVEGSHSWRGYRIRCGLEEYDDQDANGTTIISSLVVVENEDLARKRASANAVKE